MGEGNADMIYRLQSSFATSSSTINPKQQPQQQPQPPASFHQLDVPQMNTALFRAQMRQFSPSLTVDNTSKRVGIPPSHPQIPPISLYSHIPGPRSPQQMVGSQGFSHASRPSHSRSLSQPAFFSLDSLPPLSPSPYRDSPSAPTSDQISGDASMEEHKGNSHSLIPPASPFARGNSVQNGDNLPPRKAHRRSYSEVPFTFSTILQSSPPLIPLKGFNSESKPVQLVKRESSCERSGSEGLQDQKLQVEVDDDFFSAYMNLDNIDTLNSFENCEDLDSRASGTKANGGDSTLSSDNEATSSVNDMYKREGIKRSVGGEIAPTTRHYRSVSMDSFMGKMNFADELPNKLSPSLGGQIGQLSPSDSMDLNSNALSVELANGEFSEAELKKIMSNEKLAEVALNDPKRAKRILANRQSAARSKERKMRYITELEHKVQTLQNEATTLSAQVTLLQRDSAELKSQNNELKFRLQAMEQQTHLRDALNEALTSEVQCLRITCAEQNGDAVKFSQLSINNPQIFQMHHQIQHQNGIPTSNHESDH